MVNCTGGSGSVTKLHKREGKALTMERFPTRPVEDGLAFLEQPDQCESDADDVDFCGYGL